MALIKTTIVIWSQTDSWSSLPESPDDFGDLVESVDDDESVVGRVTSVRVEAPEEDKDWTPDAAEFFEEADDEDDDGGDDEDDE